MGKGGEGTVLAERRPTSTTTTTVTATSSDQSKSSSQDSRDRLITWEEVRLHTTKGDSWFVIEGDVYDTSRFARHHPGGHVLTHWHGQDATVCMRARAGACVCACVRARVCMRVYARKCLRYDVEPPWESIYMYCTMKYRLLIYISVYSIESISVYSIESISVYSIDSISVYSIESISVYSDIQFYRLYRFVYHYIYITRLIYRCYSLYAVYTVQGICSLRTLWHLHQSSQDILPDCLVFMSIYIYIYIPVACYVSGRCLTMTNTHWLTSGVDRVPGRPLT